MGVRALVCADSDVACRLRLLRVRALVEDGLRGSDVLLRFGLIPTPGGKTKLLRQIQPCRHGRRLCGSSP